MTKNIVAKRALILFIGVLLMLSSCVNLKSVGDFSAASITGIINFERINYSFSQHCLDRCEDEAVGKYDLKRARECSCALYIEADSVTQVIYNSIEGYFEGLGQLSQNELTTYNSDAVIRALTAEEFGPVRIDEQTATAFMSLSNTLLRASTDFYRRKKLAKYIERANEPIQVLLTKFEQIVGSNLTGELKFKRERMYAHHMDMKMNRTLTSDYEKGKATSEYYKGLKAIQRKDMELKIFAQSLTQIAEGHQLLFLNRTKLSVKDLQGMLQSYSGNVNHLMSQFNKLNN
jgi:hypothetical protein